MASTAAALPPDPASQHNYHTAEDASASLTYVIVEARSCPLCYWIMLEALQVDERHVQNGLIRAQHIGDWSSFLTTPIRQGGAPQ